MWHIEVYKDDELVDKHYQFVRNAPGAFVKSDMALKNNAYTFIRDEYYIDKWSPGWVADKRTDNPLRVRKWRRRADQYKIVLVDDHRG